MKRVFIILGSFFILAGLLYEMLPFDLFLAISSTLDSNPKPIYFRVMPSSGIDPVQLALLILGAFFLLLGFLSRLSKEQN